MSWRQRIAQAVEARSADLVALTRDLVAIPSVGGSEAELEAQRHVAGWLARRGLEVQQREVLLSPERPDFPGMEIARDRVLRVVARVPGGDGPTMLFEGHTDVVPADPSAFAPTVAGDHLYGRGACDMKAGVAAMCVAAVAVADCGLRLGGDLLVAPVSAEEDGGAGAQVLLDGLRLPPGSAAVIPEPTSNRIISANGGSLTFRITLRGRSAHGALRWQGVNPLDHVPAVLAVLREHEQTRCAGAGELFAGVPLPYPISVGTIAGGDWASTVPDQVTLTGRYGVMLGESLPAARAALADALAELSRQDPWLASHPPELVWWGAQFASAQTPEDAPVIAALRRAGAPEPLSAAPYGSDLRLLRAAGIDCVQFGPGDPAMAHSSQERVSIPDVLRCARVLATAAAEFGGVCG